MYSPNPGDQRVIICVTVIHHSDDADNSASKPSIALNLATDGTPSALVLPAPMAQPPLKPMRAAPTVVTLAA